MHSLTSRQNMFAQTFHLVRRAARQVAITAGLGLGISLSLGLGLGILSGCQAIVTSTPQAHVRVIDASPDAPALDIYRRASNAEVSNAEGGSALAYNLGSGTLTSYIPFTPGNYTIAAETAGTRQTLSSSKATFADAAQYTVLIGNIAASLNHHVLTDQSHAAPAGQIALRFIDQATRIGAVDLYLVPAGQKLTAVSPLLTGVTFDTNTGYLTIPNGAYTLVALATGTLPTSTAIPEYTGARITYSAGAARTIILIDQQAPAPGLQVITADDFDSPIATD